jgi:hypothetical protein
VIIDGLNEANPDARQSIFAALREFPRSTIVIASQPTGWRPPATMAIYDVLPLQTQQIKNYLLFKGPQDTTYHTRIDRVIQSHLLDPSLSPSQIDLAKEFLSNPFDLDLLATVLTKTHQATIYNIVKSFFEIVVAEYETLYDETFPIRSLSSAAYNARLDETRVLRGEDLSPQLLEFLIQKRILTLRTTDLPKYFFRHDKLQDYLIIRHLDAHPELQDENIADVRFTGVYTMLAAELPKDSARKLQEQLALAAARSKEHSIVDAFVVRLAQRGLIKAA